MVRSDVGGLWRAGNSEAFTVKQGCGLRLPVDSQPVRPKAELLPQSKDVRAELKALRTEVERLATELTDMRAHASLLESLAQEDPLTGLLNRRGFFRDLARAVAYRTRYNTPVALLLADLDGFKAINDAHGHEVGDRALVHVATLLRNNVRASDSVGRLGGDEFAIILWQVDESSALQKAASLEGMIAGSPLRDAAGTFTLSSSIGTAMLGAKESAEEALNRSDRAMYARKAARKPA
jgi:diguanylate cyclase (GGDEF)-like protein